MKVLEQERSVVYVVDSDSSVRRAMKRLLLASQMQAQTFATLDEFLKSNFRKQNSCLIVEVNGKADGSLELQKSLAIMHVELPVIFVTTLDNSRVRKQLKRAGAVGYLRKPVDDQALLDTIRWAISDHTPI
jgi:FixJ family two-component response regulator